MNTKDAMKRWNAGLTADQVHALYGEDVSAMFATFEKEVGCRSFTVDELLSGIIGHKYPNRDNEPEWYRAWKGEIGYGKQLREVAKGLR